jgi:hypothetical protein
MKTLLELTFALVLVAAVPATDDEAVIHEAVLASYWNEMHGGTGIAFPKERKPAVLHQMTIAPRAELLEVRVASPANRESARRYSELSPEPLVDLVRRSMRATPLRSRSPMFVNGRLHRGRCGFELEHNVNTDAVGLSRPGFSTDRANALVYLEGAGIGRAYYLRRAGGTWQVQWRVELWACG